MLRPRSPSLSNGVGVGSACQKRGIWKRMDRTPSWRRTYRPGESELLVPGRVRERPVCFGYDHVSRASSPSVLPHAPTEALVLARVARVVRVVHSSVAVRAVPDLARHGASPRKGPPTFGVVRGSSPESGARAARGNLAGVDRPMEAPRLLSWNGAGLPVAAGLKGGRRGRGVAHLPHPCSLERRGRS